MKSKIIGKVISQINMKPIKRPSGTLADKRIQHVRMIEVKVVTEDKKKY